MLSLWEYRSLIKKFAITDLKLRYKNSILGLFWSLLQPLLMFAVLFIVFNNFFNNGSIKDYPLYLLLGIICWGFLEKATTLSMGSILGRASLVKKVYFPREVLVLSACVTAMMMTMIEMVVFAVLMLLYGLIYGIAPGVTVLVAPLILIIEFFMVLGVSMAIAALNVPYRDIQYIWGVIMQAGFFLTPILYDAKLIFGTGGLLMLLKYNPMGVIMDSLRSVIIYGSMPVIDDVLYVILLSLILLAAGWFIFSRIEPVFAEEI